MKTTYLLPCQCGESFQVEASESGLVMKCRCGASLEVPTLRGLARLEKVVVEEPSSARRAWGGAQRGMAIGGLIAAIGIALSIYWTWWRPIRGPQDFFSESDLSFLVPRDPEIGSSPAEALLLWRRIELDGLWAAPQHRLEPYHRAREIVTWWCVISYAVTGVGLTVLAASFVAFRMGRPCLALGNAEAKERRSEEAKQRRNDEAKKPT